MRAGVDLAIGDFVFEFDSMPHPLDSHLIMSLYRKALDEGYDVVSAVPSSSTCRLSSKLFYSLFNKAAKLENEIHTESFRIISRRAINRVTSLTNFVPYRKVAYATCGLPLATVSVGETNNMYGREGARVRGELATNALLLFTHVGYKTALLFSCMMMIFTVAIIAYSLVVYLMGGAVAGWTTTILFLSFSFFCLFGVLAIVVKYLQMLVDMIFQRKDYSFKSVERL